MDTQPRTPDTLERLRGLWKRRRRPAIAVASLLAAAGAGIALGLPSFYQARTTILVDRANLPAAVAAPATTEEIEAKIGALREMTLSRSRLGELVKRFNLYPDLRGAAEDDVVQKMRRDIQLELDHRIPVGPEATVSLSLAYRSTDPATSAAVTNALAAYFLEGEGEKGLRQSSEAADLLRTQMDDVQRKMDAQEKLIADYKARQGANLPEQLMANLATLERLNGQIERNRDWQQRLFERRETLARYARPDAIPDIGPETAEQRIVRLREDLGQLRLRYSDSHPDVAQLRSQIGSLEKDLANAAAAPAEANGKVVTAAAAAPPPSFPREDRELDRLRVEEQDLRRQYAMYQSRVEAAPARDHELRELTRDYEASKALYASLFQRHAETRLAGRLEQRRADERFRVLDEAVVPSKPLGPDRPRLILLVVAGAIGAAFAAALLLERLDTTFHATEQLRGTRVPILQGIPRIRTAHGALARGMTGFAVAAGGLALLSAVFLVCYRVALENTDLSILALRGAGS